MRRVRAPGTAGSGCGGRCGRSIGAAAAARAGRAAAAVEPVALPAEAIGSPRCGSSEPDEACPGARRRRAPASRSACSPTTASTPIARYQSRSGRRAVRAVGVATAWRAHLAARRRVAHLRASGSALTPCTMSCGPAALDDLDAANCDQSRSYARDCDRGQHEWRAESGPAELPPREAMEFDVVIVGAGPPGLAAAIRLKQLAAEAGSELSVVVLEKGSEVGAHILSGAVIDPIGLNRLIPDWKEKGAPVETPVTEDRFLLPGPRRRHAPAELPDAAADEQSRQLHRQPRRAVRWLGEQAAELGVEIYPGFAAAEVLYDEKGAVVGVATGDMGVGRDGEPKDSFTRGMELRGKYTLLRRGRARLAGQAADRAVSSSTTGASRRSTASASRSCGRSRRRSTSRVSCSTRSAGRSTTAPAAARSSITTATTSCRSASSCISTTRTPTSRPTTSSSASRRIRPSAPPSRAASASPTARAPSPKAAGSRSRSSSSPAAR